MRKRLARISAVMVLLVAFVVTSCGGGGGNSGGGGITTAPDIGVTDSVAPGDDLQAAFGSVTLGSTSDHTVTVTNNGTANLVIGTIASANTLTAPFSITTDNCSGQTITPSTACSLTVRFAPAGAGSFTDSFDIPGNDPDSSSITIAISGTGTASLVSDITVTDSVSPSDDLQVAFGSITQNSTSDQTVTITNTGTASLVIGTVASANPLAAPFTITADNCSGQTIAPAATCTLTVRFAPSAPGSFTESFNIQSNDPDTSFVTISISGTGTSSSVPDIAVTDSVSPADDLQMAFGSIAQGSTSDQTVTITNAGTASLVIGTVASANPLAAPFTITADNCSGQTIAPTATCTLTVRFAPAGPGLYTDNFDIPSNDPDAVSLALSIAGTGVSAATQGQMGGSIQSNALILDNTVATFAGASLIGSADGTGSEAKFYYPSSVAADGDYLYVADTFNHTIRKIVIATGAVTTIAGTAGAPGSTDGTGSEARFYSPYGIVSDGTNLYVSDTKNHTIRKIVISTGAVTTLAGTPGNSGSTDGTGAAAKFYEPHGITLEGTNLYVADKENFMIRKIALPAGAVTTIAGMLNQNVSTDGTGTAAKFDRPWGITTDGTSLYVTDESSYTIRKMVLSTGRSPRLQGLPVFRA